MIDIIGKAVISGKEITCKGYIEIGGLHAGNVYVSWQLFDEDGSILAGYSRSYFIEEKESTPEEIIKFAVTKIESYRMRRRKLFKNIQIVKPEAKR